MTECNCHISYYPKPDHIIYCPLHKSALDMYEALRQYERSGILEEFPTWLQGLRNILAKVKGKPDNQDEQELDERRLNALLQNEK